MEVSVVLPLARAFYLQRRFSVPYLPHFWSTVRLLLLRHARGLLLCFFRINQKVGKALTDKISVDTDLS